MKSITAGQVLKYIFDEWADDGECPLHDENGTSYIDADRPPWSQRCSNCSHNEDRETDGGHDYDITMCWLHYYKERIQSKAKREGRK